jgi:murein DD-endopeptidase MepM/ murein hydrolase activator NlpD
MAIEIQNNFKPSDTTLIFTHPEIRHRVSGDLLPLTIKSGANEIRWGYQLNTRTISTYGGEVNQILSAYVDRLNIKGNTWNNIQLEIIHQWFRKYMHLAGAKRPRSQQPVTFKYPERGWKFNIFPIEVPNLALGKERVAQEWELIAEIEDPEDEQIVNEVMKPLNDKVVIGNFKAIPRGVLSGSKYPFYLNPYSEELPLYKKKLSDREIESYLNDVIETRGGELGNTLDSIIGANASGHFPGYIFSPGLSPEDNGLSPADEYYKTIFGSIYLVNQAGANTTGSTYGGAAGTGYSATGILEPELVAAVAVAGGFPANQDVLTEAVAVAYGESNLKVDADNNICCVGLWQINLLDKKGVPYKDNTRQGYNLQQLTTDPVLNAKVAFKIWEGASRRWGDGQGSGNPWEAHGGAAYNSYKATAGAAVSNYLADRTKWNNILDGLKSSTGSASGKLVFPLPKVVSYAGGVAAHMSRALGNWESDNAVDLMSPEGTPVFAVSDGTISSGKGYGISTSNNPKVYGARLHLDTSNGNFYYQHMKFPFASGVTPGAKVTVGQLLGKIESGNIKGGGIPDHLHLGMDPSTGVGNPEKFLDIVTGKSAAPGGTSGSGANVSNNLTLSGRSLALSSRVSFNSGAHKSDVYYAGNIFEGTTWMATEIISLGLYISKEYTIMIGSARSTHSVGPNGRPTGISNHKYGACFDIVSVNGSAVNSGNGTANTLYNQIISGHFGGLKPTEVVSPWNDDGHHDDHIHVGWDVGTVSDGSRRRPYLSTAQKWSSV